MGCEKLIIPQDSIVGNSLFGGKVYAATCTFGGIGSPSTLTLEIMSKDGNYSIISPTQNDKFYKVLPFFNINLGNNFYFNGFYVNYTYSKQAGIKKLFATFKDGSVCLDQITVGLHKKWGDKNNNKADDLILVGKEYNPCDTNFDSTIDYQDDGQSPIDWCDPCPFCPPNKYEDRCVSQEWQVYPVRYTINELIAALPRYNINVVNASAFDKFKENPNEYTGSLRSVLQSWCSEFGLSFYWDYNNNNLVFIDLGVDVNIDFDKYIDLDNIDEYIQMESIEDTYSQGVVSYFEREGEIKNYQCSSNTVVNTRPLSYKDLVKYNSGMSDEEKRKIRDKELSISLSYFSSTLRECLWWFYHYGITDATKAEQYVFNSNGFLNPDTAAQEGNKILTELANMKILKVCAPKNDNAALFTMFENALPPETKTLLLNKSKVDDKNKECPDGSYYFIIADFDNELLAKQYAEDNNLAENYLGNFWIRQYNPNLCCGNSSISNINVKTSDGNASFYEAFSNVNGLKFASFGYTPDSYVGSILKASDSAEGNEPSSNDFGGKNYKTLASFLLANRSAKWSPNSSQLDQYADLFNFYRDNYNFALLGQNGRPDVLMDAYEPAREGANIRVILCKAGNIPVFVSEVNNPLETRNQNKLYTTTFNNSNNGGPYQELEAGRIGLTSRQCYQIKFGGFDFITPVGGITLDGLTINEQELNVSSAYSVLVSQNFPQQNIIPKVQNNYIVSATNRGLKNEYLYKVIDSQILNIFQNNSCTPSSEKLLQIHKLITEYLGSEKVWPSKSVEFSAAGTVPYQISIEEGLENFTIAFGDNGVFTRYKISTRYAQPITDTILQEILTNISQRLINSKTVPNYKTNPQLTYPIV